MLNGALSIITTTLNSLTSWFGGIYSAVGISIFMFIVGAFTVKLVISTLTSSGVNPTVATSVSNIFKSRSKGD